MADAAASGRTVEAKRVSTLELFFDLVFVFTISQIALLLEEHATWSSAAQGLLELFVIFWMYGGFAWLTNTIGSQTPRQRAVLLLGMAAFLVVSLAVPRAFGDDGIAFGWAYVVLNAVHLAGFLIGGVPGAASVMRRMGPVNLVASGLVLAACYAGAPWYWWLFPLAIVTQWGTAVVRLESATFAIDAGHFAERHGLMVIIVLGESLVSVAVAAQDVTVDWSLVLGVLCGLAASGAMWWCYFAGDDDAAVEAFDRRPDRTRGRTALIGYDLPHVLMVAGVVALAAGSRLSLPDLLAPTPTRAATLIAGGVAVYLAALALFRAVLRFANPVPRLVAAVLVLATIPVGTHWGAAQQLLIAAVVLSALLVAERALDAQHPARR